MKPAKSESVTIVESTFWRFSNSAELSEDTKFTKSFNSSIFSSNAVISSLNEIEFTASKIFSNLWIP